MIKAKKYESVEEVISSLDLIQNGECLESSKMLSTHGYPRIYSGRKLWFTGRLILYLRGENITDFEMMHSCDNRKCINPKHLRVGTRSQNIKDCWDRGRHPKPNTRGENNVTSKLNNPDVIFIRIAHTLKFNSREIAKLLKNKVHDRTIRDVINNRTWARITP